MVDCACVWELEVRMRLVHLDQIRLQKTASYETAKHVFVCVSDDAVEGQTIRNQ